jgi:hypothetical protein
MKTGALQSTSDSAPANKQQKEAIHPRPVSPRLIQSVSLSDGAVIPRKAACACGGGCPRCSAGNGLLDKRISEPGGVYEQEADRVANQVMRAAATSPGRAAPVGDASARSSPAGRSGDAELGSGGQPLSDGQRAMFESRLGADLSQVRIHTGSQATDLSRSLDAEAFTWGRHIVVGVDSLPQETVAANELLAHELTHVVQQGAVPTSEISPLSSMGHAGLSRASQPMIMRRLLRNAPVNFFCGADDASLRSPPTGTFHLNTGEKSVTVTVDLHWDRPSCGQGGSVFVELIRQRSGFWSVIGNHSEGDKTFPVGPSTSDTWSGVDDDSDYFLQIRSSNTNPNCCLTGTIRVDTP